MFMPYLDFVQYGYEIEKVWNGSRSLCCSECRGSRIVHENDKEEYAGKMCQRELYKNSNSRHDRGLIHLFSLVVPDSYRLYEF